MIDPTDRSMPPAMMTTASPSANSAISEMWRTSLFRLSALRKLDGLMIAVMIASAIITPSMVSSFLKARMLNLESGRQLQDVGVGQLGARQLARDGAAAHHQRAVAQRRDLVGLGAGDDDALPLRRQLARDVVYVALGFHVQAARRLVQQQHGGRPRHPLGEH